MTQALAESGRLFLAAALGGLLGWQREFEGRPAGVRTHMLVATGACLMTLVRFEGADPSRIAAQIVTGIGFLGAGVILRRGLSVRGLTTAASVWMAAGIGIAVGAGGDNWILASVAALISLFVLTVVKRWEEAISREGRQATLLLTIPRHHGKVSQVLEAITGVGASVIAFDADENVSAAARSVVVTLRLDKQVTRAQIAAALTLQAADVAFEWEG